MASTSHINVLAISDDSQEGGDVATLMQHVLRELELEGIRTESIQLSGAEIRACLACQICSSGHNKGCVQDNDACNAFIERMEQADGILIGARAGIEGATPELIALLDRACMVGKANGRCFRHKVGAAVVSFQPPGAVKTFDEINHFFLVNEMIVVGSSYWDVGVGSDAGELALDPDGNLRMRMLGRNFAWLLENLHRPEATLDLVEIVSQ